MEFRTIQEVEFRGQGIWESVPSPIVRYIQHNLIKDPWGSGEIKLPGTPKVVTALNKSKTIVVEETNGDLRILSPGKQGYQEIWSLPNQKARHVKIADPYIFYRTGKDKILDLRNGNILYAYNRNNFLSFDLDTVEVNPVNPNLVMDKNRMFLFLKGDGHLPIFEMRSIGEFEFPLPGEGTRSFKPNGDFQVVWNRPEDQEKNFTIPLIDLKKQDEKFRFPSPDGESLLIPSPVPGNLALVPNTAKFPYLLPENIGCVWSPDSKYALINGYWPEDGESSLKVFSKETGSVIQTIRYTTHMTPVHWEGPGRFSIGGMPGTIQEGTNWIYTNEGIHKAPETFEDLLFLLKQGAVPSKYPVTRSFDIGDVIRHSKAEVGYATSRSSNRILTFKGNEILNTLEGGTTPVECSNPSKDKPAFMFEGLNGGVVLLYSDGGLEILSTWPGSNPRMRENALILDHPNGQEMVFPDYDFEGATGFKLAINDSVVVNFSDKTEVFFADGETLSFKMTAELSGPYLMSIKDRKVFDLRTRDWLPTPTRGDYFVHASSEDGNHLLYSNGEFLSVWSVLENRFVFRTMVSRVLRYGNGPGVFLLTSLLDTEGNTLWSVEDPVQPEPYDFLFVTPDGTKVYEGRRKPYGGYKDIKVRDRKGDEKPFNCLPRVHFHYCESSDPDHGSFVIFENSLDEINPEEGFIYRFPRSIFRNETHGIMSLDPVYWTTTVDDSDLVLSVEFREDDQGKLHAEGIRLKDKVPLNIRWYKTENHKQHARSALLDELVAMEEQEKPDFDFFIPEETPSAISSIGSSLWEGAKMALATSVSAGTVLTSAAGLTLAETMKESSGKKALQGASKSALMGLVFQKTQSVFADLKPPLTSQANVTQESGVLTQEGVPFLDEIPVAEFTPS